MTPNNGNVQPPTRLGQHLTRQSLPLLPIDATLPKRPRKDRGPNWLPQEVTVLVNIKRDMYLEEIDTVDARDLMNPDATKWFRVSQEVMKAGFSPCVRDAVACKTKWNQIIPDYKRIADFFARTGRNGKDYWNMTTANRKTKGLPRSFPRNIFDNIHDWFGKRPTMQPPHTRDLLSEDDNNYMPTRLGSTQNGEEGDNELEGEDAMDVVEEVEGTEDTSIHTPPPVRAITSSTASGAAAFLQTGTRSARGKSKLLIGVTPHIISSSDTGDSKARRRLGNTVVKRKSISGHDLIAEATKASGVVMADQMHEMAEASRDLERSKLEVQLKLFAEQMDYQREKDRRLHESSLIANENAKLAIEK